MVFKKFTSLFLFYLVCATGEATKFGVRQPSSVISLRAGSSFQPRTPSRVVPPPGQASKQQRLSQINPAKGEEKVDTKELIDAFLTRDSRNSFIARVYAILSVQLVVTGLSCVLFGVVPSLSNLSRLIHKGHAAHLAYIPLASVFVSTIAWYRVCTSPEARRTSPNKWLWLSIFTVGEAISVGFLSSLFKFRSVVTAMGATAFASSTVSLYTIMQTDPNRDLSQLGSTLSSWAMILLAYLFIGIFQQAGLLPAGFLPFSEFLYSLLAACLFSAFLAYHTKLIVAGKHSKYRMNEQDYVLGAMTLYSDVVNIFLNILQMIGDDKD